MAKAKRLVNEIDLYISKFPPETRVLLEQLRAIIQKAAPQAEEVISYQMPAYRQQGMLVFFAGYPNHIGFYPTGSGIAAFKDEITKYKSSKGAVQFPLDKPLPVGLITRMVKFKVKENQGKQMGKSLKKVRK